MAQKDNESFKEYAQHWRELTVIVHPPLVDNELINLFMSTLQGKYYEKLISSVLSGLSDMVIIGEIIKKGLKNGNIQGSSSIQAGVKIPFNGCKKKKGETNAISSQRGKNKRESPLQYLTFNTRMLQPHNILW